jgi:hypothetical protein
MSKKPDYDKANKIKEDISREMAEQRRLQEEFNRLSADKDPKAIMKKMSECAARLRSLNDELAKTGTSGWF